MLKRNQTQHNMSQYKQWWGRKIRKGQKLGYHGNSQDVG